MSNIANSRLKSGVKEKFSVGRAAPLQCGRLALLPIMELKPDPSNPRKHGREQIRAIARSIAAFGFNAPILIDRNKQIVAGHGRYEAAKLNQCAEVPVVWLEHLTETQARAYMLADNKLTDRSSWDDAALAVHLKELSELVLDFDIEDIGFELPEIDFRIQSLDAWTTRTSRMSFSPSRASPSPGPAISGGSAITGSIAARRWRRPPMTSSSMAPRRPPCSPTRLTM